MSLIIKFFYVIISIVIIFLFENVRSALSEDRVKSKDINEIDKFRRFLQATSASHLDTGIGTKVLSGTTGAGHSGINAKGTRLPDPKRNSDVPQNSKYPHSHTYRYEYYRIYDRVRNMTSRSEPQKYYFSIIAIFRNEGKISPPSCKITQILLTHYFLNA